MSRIRLRALLTVLVLATSLPGMLLAGWLVIDTWYEQRDLIDRQTVETARAVSVAIDQEIETTKAALRILATSPFLTGSDLSMFHARLLNALPTQPRWHAVILVDPSATVVMDTSAPPEGPPNLAAGPWCAEVLSSQRATVSNLLHDPASGLYYAIVAVPVMQGSRLRYVLGAQIDAASLTEVLRRQGPPAGGVLTLLDAAGRIVARTRNEARYVGGTPSPGFRSAVASMNEGAWREVLLEGTSAYAAMSRSPVTGWTVGIGIPAEEIDAPLRASLTSLAAAGGALVALGLAVALVLSRGVVRSIASAADSVRLLAAGETMPRWTSPIEELSQLAQGLSDARETLDARLRERNAAEEARAHAAEQREAALRAEEEARVAGAENEARLAVTLNSIGDAVIATDVDGRITLLNRVAQSLTGWSETEAIGQPIDRVFAVLDDQGQPLESPVARVVREGVVTGLAHHATLVSRDGRSIPVEDSAAPIRAPDGGLLGVVLVFRDGTERRETERRKRALLEQEQTARRQAEAVSRSKDDFVAMVSHELRTPLNAIFGWVRILRSGGLDAAARDHALDVIDRNVRLQAQLIEDLLDVSRVVTGKLRLEVRPVDLGTVLDASVDAVAPSASAKGITVGKTIEPELPSVLGDADRLQQIVWNLLSNSIRFTPPGGRIGARLLRDGAEVVIEVQDTGAGIAPDLLPHVFDRFRQGASPSSRAHGGLGIGLSLVHHLVALHGGTVTAASAGDGQGATFTVRLPAALRPVLAGPVVPAASAAAPSLEGLRVLVVDDDRDARELVCTVLGRAGAQTAEAASVDEALSVLRTFPPDAVVSDVAMPGATGYDLVRRLRQMEGLGHVPAVALTAYARLDDREHALAAGFDRHLGKPVDPAQLVAVVAGLVAPRPH